MYSIHLSCRCGITAILDTSVTFTCDTKVRILQEKC